MQVPSGACVARDSFFCGPWGSLLQSVKTAVYENPSLVSPKFLLAHSLARPDCRSVFQGTDAGLPAHQRGRVGRPPIQSRCGTDLARLVGGR